MDTHFATPRRSNADELNRQIQFATCNPVIDGILTMVGGLVAVLNPNRQIVAVNHRMLDLLKIDNPKEILGLRPGEALGCCYSAVTEGGCGTSPFCVTCGAAIAIVSTLGTYGPSERSCAITVEKGGEHVDLFFLVKATTIKIEGERFVLIFLNDITQQQHQAALERTFFHDIKNTIMALLNASEILANSLPDEGLTMAELILNLSRRLSYEVELQRHLSKDGSMELDLNRRAVAVEHIITEVETMVLHHPAKKNMRLKSHNHAPGVAITTDLPLLVRVLGNMLINAFEADNAEQVVRLNIEKDDSKVIFSVWNSQAISPSVGRRVFQRNFSTKDQIGRGFGTYSMKLIGEQLLGGRVGFDTSREEGTKFFIELQTDMTSD